MITDSKFYCLASSSSGNAFIFEIGDTAILIECGIPLKEIYAKCNNAKIDFSKIKACLITHAHNDHCKSAKDIERLNIPIYASNDTLQAIKCKGIVLNNEQPITIAKGVAVMPFYVNHDIDGAMGFIIKSKETTIIFINDSKSWNADLRNFKPQYVFIECNFDDKIVYAQLNELKKEIQNVVLGEKDYKEEHIQIAQHERNVKAHQSLRTCINGLRKLNLSQCRCIFLMHLSDRYANEYKFKNTIQQEFGIKTLVCGKKGGIK